MKQLKFLSVCAILIAILAVPFTVLAAPSAVKSTATGSNFFSSFNGSAPGWTHISGPWSLAGSAYYSTAGGANHWSSIAHAGTYSNMTYQATMMRMGCVWCSNTLLIRGNPALSNSYNDWTSSYQFSYTADGYFSVWRVIGQSFVPLKQWAYSSAIHQGNAWNNVKVIANGISLKFYINSLLVWSGNNGAMSTGRVGIAMYRDGQSAGNRLSIDSASLVQIAAASPQNTDEVVAPSTEVSGGTPYGRQ